MEACGDDTLSSLNPLQVREPQQTFSSVKPAFPHSPEAPVHSPEGNLNPEVILMKGT